MGIDWEEILGAEGEDMADAYDDATESDSDDYYNADRAPAEEPYDDDYDDVDWAYDALYNEFCGAQMVICQQLKDLKKLLAALKEHNIVIPEGIEERYQNHSTYELYDEYDPSKKYEVEEETKEQVRKAWKALEEAEKSAEVPVIEFGDEEPSDEDLEPFT